MSNDKESSLFISLIISLQTAAMQQLGKLLNPLTGKMERDLAQARVTIDLLSALKNRTRGNLNPEEERILSVSLTELQLNFVDEMKKEQEVPKAEEEAPEGEAPPVEVAEEAPATKVEEGVEEAEEKPPTPVVEKAPPEEEAEKAEKKPPKAKKAAKPKKRRTPKKGDKKDEPAKSKNKGKKQ